MFWIRLISFYQIALSRNSPIIAALNHIAIEKVKNLVTILKALKKCELRSDGEYISVILNQYTVIGQLQKAISDYQDSNKPDIMVEILQKYTTKTNQLNKALEKLNPLLDDFNINVQQAILNMSGEMYCLSQKGDFWQEVKSYHPSLANIESVFKLFEDREVQSDPIGSVQEEAQDL